MDPFAIPRATFKLYLQLVQFPFEVGLRLLGRGDDERVEEAGDRVDATVGDEQRRGSAKPRRQRAANGGGQAASQGGQAGSRQRQATRRGQAHDATATRKRGARERPTDASAPSETAAGEVAEDVQERIETARGEAAASEREAPEQPAETTTQGEAHDRAGGIEDHGEAAPQRETASHRDVPEREVTQPAKPGEPRADDAAESVQERIEAAARRARLDQLGDQAERRGQTPGVEDAADRLRAQAENARAAERRGQTPGVEDAADRLRAQAENARAAEREW
jgi:hypothetical protein